MIVIITLNDKGNKNLMFLSPLSLFFLAHQSESKNAKETVCMW